MEVDGVSVNKWPGQCSTCGRAIPAKEGEYFENPLRLVCASCALFEGVDPGDLEERLSMLPLKAEGKDDPVDLLSFQREDVRKAASTRALLFGHRMGLGKCSHSNTLALINGCLVSMGEAWNRYSGEAWFDGEGWWAEPKAELTVCSLSESGEIVKGKVARLYRQEVREALEQVRLNDGSEITTTGVHKFLKVDEWEQANRIGRGDKVCVPRRLPHEEGKLDLDLAELFGWMVGDGCERNRYSCVVTQKEERVLARVEDLFDLVTKRFGVHDKSRSRYCSRASHRSPNVSLGGQGFVSFCESHDYPWSTLSKDRRVPYPIMKAGPEPVRKFIRAYFDANGSCPRDFGSVEVSSASQLLIKEVGILLRRFGIWLRTRKKRARATNRSGKWRNYWVGTIGGPSLRRFKDEIGFGVDYKQAELEKICSKKANTNMEGGPASKLVSADVRGARGRVGSRIKREVFYPKVDSAESVWHEGWVYDLEVEEHHNFVAEGILCHNTIIASFGALRSDRPNFVFSPASVKRNWQREIQTWRPDLDPNVCDSKETMWSSMLAVLREWNVCSLCGTEFDREHPEWVACASCEVHIHYACWERSGCPKCGKVGLLPPEEFKPPKAPVLIGSYGSIPGDPCPGCKDLAKRLKALKAEKYFYRDKERGRFSGRIPRDCTHVEAEFFSGDQEKHSPVHPEYYPVSLLEKDEEGNVKKVHYARFPYHVVRDRSGAEVNCPGCSQEYPIPPIRRKVVAMSDESHAFKTASALRTRNWRRLAGAVWSAGGHLFGLTGTACEGKAGEFWEVLRSLKLERAAFGSWGTYYRLFRGQFDNKKGSRVAPGERDSDEIVARLRLVQIRRRRRDVLDQLPPRIPETRHVELNQKTYDLINEAVHRMLAVRRTWEEVRRGEAPGGVPLLNPFQRGLSNSEKSRRKAVYEDRVTYYFEERPWRTDEELTEAVKAVLMYEDELPALHELSKIRALLSQAKFQAVMDWVESAEDNEEPAVVFSQHVRILQQVADRPGWELFYGGISDKRRDEIVQDFQGGKIKHGLAVSIGAGGEGITLTRARVCCFIDLSWNPAKNDQAEARLLRIGAEKHDSIVVVRFVADHPVDRLVIATLREKQELLDAIEDDGREILWTFDPEDDEGCR